MECGKTPRPARSEPSSAAFRRESLPAKIVSGGQSGVDRAALDWAIRNGIPYGGWCPKGGLAEDLPEPPGLLVRYPRLKATPSEDPAERTAWNVRDSDATLVIRVADRRSPGTNLTIEQARERDRPLLVIELPSVSVSPVAGPREAMTTFIDEAAAGRILNVAGPRESQVRGIYRAVSYIFESML